MKGNRMQSAIGTFQVSTWRNMQKYEWHHSLSDVNCLQCSNYDSVIGNPGFLWLQASMVWFHECECSMIRLSVISGISTVNSVFFCQCLSTQRNIFSGNGWGGDTAHWTKVGMTCCGCDHFWQRKAQYLYTQLQTHTTQCNISNIRTYLHQHVPNEIIQIYTVMSHVIPEFSGGVSSFKPSTDPKTSRFFWSRTLDFGQFSMDFLGSKNKPAFFWSKAHSFGVSVGAGNQGTEWWNDELMVVSMVFANPPGIMIRENSWFAYLSAFSTRSDMVPFAVTWCG